MSAEQDVERYVAAMALKQPPAMVVGVIELCATLGVSERTVRRWQQAGRMPPVKKHGRRLVYQAADISTWLAEQVRG